MSDSAELLPILLNGKRYTLDPTSSFAINSEGRAIRLDDAEKGSRFR